MVYIKYMPYKSIRNASRNRRELGAARESGFHTVLFSADTAIEPPEPAVDELVHDGTKPMPAGKLQKVATVLRNRLTVYRNTMKLPTGAWSCHDLHSLKIAYFVTRFRLHRPQLIYDSHEFELGRNAKRNAFQRFRITLEERFLMKRCVFSIVVNDTIADEVQRIHRLKNRPIVLRSTPDNWQIDERVCRQKRQQLLRAFGENEENG